MPVRRNSIYNRTAKKRGKHRVISTNNAHSEMELKKHNRESSVFRGNVASSYDRNENYVGVATMGIKRKALAFSGATERSEREAPNFESLIEQAETHEEMRSAYDLETPMIYKRNKKSNKEIADECSAKYDELFKGLVHR